MSLASSRVNGGNDGGVGCLFIMIEIDWGPMIGVTPYYG